MEFSVLKQRVVLLVLALALAVVAEILIQSAYHSTNRQAAAGSYKVGGVIALVSIVISFVILMSLFTKRQ